MGPGFGAYSKRKFPVLADEQVSEVRNLDLIPWACFHQKYFNQQFMLRFQCLEVFLNFLHRF